MALSKSNTVNKRNKSEPSDNRLWAKNFTVAFTLVLLTFTLFSGKSVNAQTVPNAGSLKQNLEKKLEANIPSHKGTIKKPVDQKSEPKPSSKQADDSLQIIVKQFEFVGNHLFTDVQLQKVVVPYLNKPLGFDDLKQAAISISDHYRQSNWYAKTSFPKQDVTDGTVVIQIVEAVLGGWELDKQELSRIDKDVIENLVNGQLKPGDKLNAKQIERALLLADDLPGVNVAGTLNAGDKKGESVLSLKTSDEPLTRTFLSIDNLGSRLTGKGRLLASVSLNSPLKLGDFLQGTVVTSEGNHYISSLYSLPVGADGWRIGARASYLEYKLKASEFDNLDIKGNSIAAGAEATYPMIRSRRKNLYFRLSFDHNRYENESLGIIQSNYQTNVMGFELKADSFDSFWGGGANAATVAMHTGILTQGHKNPGENSELEGFYAKLRGHMSRQQSLTKSLSFFSSVAFQADLSSDELDSSEKFYLGGPHSIRAYPNNEASGDHGWLINLELRQRILNRVLVTAFVDTGHIYNTNSQAKDYGLEGAGLKIGWQTPIGLNLDATWSHRLDNNPNPAVNGDDQDGSFDKNRFWLSATYNF